MSRKFALDTNAFSAVILGDPILLRLTETAASLAVPVPVLGELYYGYFNGSKQDENLRALANFLELSQAIILEIDSVTARLYGEIATQLRRIGRPIQHNDIWIAALCKQHGFVLATRDTDFQAIIGLETVSF